MKKIVFVISLLIGNLMFGQKAKYEFEAESKQYLAFQRLSEDNHYVIGLKKEIMVLRKQDIKIIRFDENLNVKYDNNNDSLNYSSLIFTKGHSTKVWLSRKGEYLLMGDNLIDRDGNSRKYEFFDGTQFEAQNLEPFATLFTDTHLCVIGRKEGRLNEKKVYSQGDLFLFTRNHKDFKESLYELQLPQNLLEDSQDTEKILKWQFAYAFDDGFYLVHKRVDTPISKRENTEIFLVTKYDYSGNILYNKEMKVNLDHSYLRLSTNLFSGSNFVSNLYINDEKKEFYIYGTFHKDIKPKDTPKTESHTGFFVTKLNENGDVMWHKQIKVDDEEFQKNVAPYLIHIGLRKLNQNELMISMWDFEYRKKSWIYQLDEKTGDLNSNYVKEHKLNLGVSSYFLFTTKEFKNFEFDSNSYEMLTLNNDFYAYLKTLPDTDLLFNGFYLKNGGILIHQINSDTRKHTILTF